MAEIAASLVGPVIELGKCIVVPIKRQFHYLCCFDSNIQNLKDEAKKLDDAKTGIEMKIVEAQNNGKIILPEVKNWLSSTDEIQVNVSGIETRIQDVQGGYSAIKSRFSLSRKAEKLAVAIKQLRDCSKFDLLYVSQQPAAAAKSVPLGQTYEFDSRKQIEDDIMTTLRGKEINTIGLSGIGGVGKTTMAMRIMKRAREEEHLFDEVVMVVVSQQVDLLKIQLEIAELLGLKFEESTLSARAHALRARLKDGAKRTLVALDDVWKMLKLDDIGIPCESGCKVLLTSRNRDAFTAMGVEKVCGIQILSEREAWLLFKETVGALVDDSNLLSIAEAVVNECNGLPIALVTVGRALRDKKDKPIWENALRQLRSSNPIDLSDFLEQVYNPLKLSYDFLVNSHAKSMFLLCCMFPEDYNIPLEHLTLYGWGLGIFEGIGSLEEARNNAFALADMLKSRSLLIDGYRESHVKMHDVVRDTAIFIASKEGSLNLRLLLITNTSREKTMEIDDQLFEGKDGLHVLSILSASFKPLRQTMESLKNLRTLRLYSCDFLDDISIVGELSNLEILSCCRSDSIKEIPIEIRRLNRLRLLEFLDCKKVEKIAAGVISQLVRLEELKIVRSFNKWDIAGLKELESLCNLTCMEIEIMNTTLVKENLNFGQKIVKYAIRIAGRPNFVSSFEKFEKKMHIEFPGEIAPGNWIRNFVKNGEALCLKGDSSKSLNLSQIQNLKWLELEECSTMKKVVSTSSAFDVFPLLECLRLFEVHNLEEICDGSIKRGSKSFKNLRELSVHQTPRLKHLWRSPNQNVSLCNLSSVKIQSCGSMVNVFSLAIAKDCLPKLEELHIRGCEMMEEVLCKDGQILHITFAKLKRLYFSHLPKLATFCRGIGSIEFPVLTEMDIDDCPKLMSNPSSEDAHLHDVDSFHLFCNQEKVVFGNLKQLCIANNEDVSNLWCRQIPISFFNGLEKLLICNIDKSIRSLFSASVTANLVNLKDLTIWACSKLVKVIEGEEEICANKLFPNLEELRFDGLPKLEIFCEWRCDVELPSLRYVFIRNCIHMKCFSLGSVSTPKMETFVIDTSKIIDNGDLNGALLQHYESRNNVEEDDETSSM